MKQSTRQLLYACLGVANAALIAASQQGLVPPHYSQAALAVSLVLAAAMKAFGEKDPAPAAPSSPGDAK